MTTYKTTPLFGGAITVSIPSNYGDVSQIRQVPDTQEVFLAADGYTSIVFDILERVEAGDKSDVEALKFHLDDIVDEEDVGGGSGSGGSTSRTKIREMGELEFAKFPKTPTPTLLATQTHPQTANPKAGGTPDFTALLVTLLRLEAQETDIVISINIPHVAGEYDGEDVGLEEGRWGALIEEGRGMRERIGETFEVLEWGLFGGSEV